MKIVNLTSIARYNTIAPDVKGAPVPKFPLSKPGGPDLHVIEGRWVASTVLYEFSDNMGRIQAAPAMVMISDVNQESIIKHENGTHEFEARIYYVLAKLTDPTMGLDGGMRHLREMVIETATGLKYFAGYYNVEDADHLHALFASDTPVPVSKPTESTKQKHKLQLVKG